MRLARRLRRRRADSSATLRRYISRTCWAAVNESIRLDKSGTRWGTRGDGLRWRQVSGMGEGQVELALEILLGDLEILQGHVRALVTEEFHDGGKADAGAQHLSSVGVSKLVRDNAGGNSDGRHDFLQCSAEPANQHVTAARPRQ